MCIGAVVHSERVTVDPDLHMARLLSRWLGQEITREQVNDLFRHNWSRLQVMAHAIHDQQIMQES
jgi:hypothetical protein